MNLVLSCSSSYAMLLTTFCIGSTFASGPSIESTRVNTFISGVVNGGYAGEAVEELLEDIPLVNLLPLEMFSLEDEFTDFIQRESSRYARNFFRQQIGQVGLAGPLSLTGASSYSYSSGEGSISSARSRNKKTRLRARVSGRRLGLSLLFRF